MMIKMKKMLLPLLLLFLLPIQVKGDANISGHEIEFQKVTQKPTTGGGSGGSENNSSNEVNCSMIKVNFSPKGTTIRDNKNSAISGPILDLE